MYEESLRELLERLQAGDRSALEALYLQLSTPVYTVILRMTNDPTLAEDILQDFFVKLYRQPPAILPRNPRAYLFQTARNLTVDCLRRERPAVPLSDFHQTSCFTDASVDRLDLERALAALDDTDREIVTLHAGMGLTFREVAQITATPLGTVLWRYRRSVSRLQTLLNGGTL